MLDYSKTDSQRDYALQKLTILLNSRRSKFTYIDEKTGNLNSKVRVVLSALASTISTPILISLALYAYNFYLIQDIKPYDLLPAIFICIPLFILIDPILGFVYDRVEKKQRFKLQVILLTISSIGLVFSQMYLLSYKFTVRHPASTFGICIGIALFSYSLLNSNSLKNSFALSPSQDTRRKIFYLEGFFQGLAVFFIAGMPYLLKNGSDSCNCDAVCSQLVDPGCRTCLLNCQDFTGSLLFQGVSIISTLVFIAFNFLALCVIKPRKDTHNLPPYYSFNKRMFDFFKNQFLASTTFIYFLETLIVFTFVFWIGTYAFHQYDAVGNCLNGKKLTFLCVANDWIILFIILIVSFAVLSLLYFRSNAFWVLSTLTSFAAGICILFADVDSKGIFIYTLIAAAFAFSLLPTSKAYFSDSAYYDEYRTGYVLPKYLSFLFSMAAKTAFLLAAGAIISTTDNNDPPGPSITNRRIDTAAGTLIIVATSLLLIMKIRMSRFHLKAFDKIQLAIEKNQTEGVNEEIIFKDPITNEPIRRPLTPKSHEDVTNMLYLDNFARSSEIKKIVHEKYTKVRNDATVLFWFGFLQAVICIAIVAVFKDKLSQPVGWAFLFPLMSIVCGFYIMIYMANVKTTVDILMDDLPRIDKDYLNKYLYYRRQFEQF